MFYQDCRFQSWRDWDCEPIYFGLSSTSYFVLRILKMPRQASGNNAKQDETLLIDFSPFANPDNSNFYSFMSTTNYVDLDLIGKSGGHTETNGGLIAVFTCRYSLQTRTCPCRSRWSPDGDNCSMTSRHLCPASASWWLKTISDHCGLTQNIL